MFFLHCFNSSLYLQVVTAVTAEKALWEPEACRDQKVSIPGYDLLTEELEKIPRVLIELKETEVEE